jgi:hypothetical protein
MFSRVRAALLRRQAAIVEAEALVWRWGARGVEMARAYSDCPLSTEERRAHYRRVTRLAARRHRFLDGLDIATRYEVLAGWKRRRGHMLE